MRPSGHHQSGANCSHRRSRAIEAGLPAGAGGGGGLEPDGKAHSPELAKLPAALTSVKMEDKCRLYTTAPSELLLRVVDYAQPQTLRVISLNTLGPSLEDVFLEITDQQVGVRHAVGEASPGKKGQRGKRR